PLVRVRDKPTDYRGHQRQKRERMIEVRRNATTKEVQVSFSAAPGDIGHKLRKVRAEIENGHRVVLAVAQKPKQEIPNPERKAIIDEWVTQLTDIAKEWSPRQYNKTHVVVKLQPITR
ncbi:hypothetical protein K488DRAFT_11526, partial [Vararia minispora EC-137]